MAGDTTGRTTFRPGEPTDARTGRIGPNAILQLLPVLEARGGDALSRAVLADAGLDRAPAADAMVDERVVAAVHHAVRARLAGDARAVAVEAGRRTADYILAHRIPRLAQAVIRILPRAVAARILARAIAAHAWTFAGTGRFRIAGTRPLAFEIADNPLIRGETAAAPLCDWHAAVLERLFGALVDPDARVVETACAAAGAPACRFELRTAPGRRKRPARAATPRPTPVSTPFTSG